MKTCPTCRIRYPDALEFCPQDGSALPGGAPGRTQFLYDRFVGNIIDGRYKVEAKLGEGGMGIVYAARHAIIDKRVAIKVLKHEAAEDETAGQRFTQEARSASKIGHANIVDITDFGATPDGSPYFVMEFLEGRTLGQLLAAGPLEPARAIRIAAQIARGLNAAHKKGIVHRDLKPDNVFLVERDGQQEFVKIVDFGIAKLQTDPNAQRLTQAGMVLGTPEYMSPEQATGKETDYRVDEYALGCILYEMTTGEVPFRGTTSSGTLTKHVFEQLVPPSRRRPDLRIPARLEAVVMKAMEKRPDDRYPSMIEMLEALDGAGLELGTPSAGVRRVPRKSGAAAPTRPRRDGERAPTGSRRTGVKVAAAAAAAMALAAGAFFVLGRGAAPAAPPVVKATPVPSRPQPTLTPIAAPAPPAEAVFTLRSNPAGASVYVRDEKIGVTPFQYTCARGAEAVEFSFRLAGYKDLGRPLVPDGNHDVEVALVKRPAERVRASTAAADATAEAPAPSSAPAEKPRKAGLSDLRDPFN